MTFVNHSVQLYQPSAGPQPVAASAASISACEGESAPISVGPLCRAFLASRLAVAFSSAASAAL